MCVRLGDDDRVGRFGHGRTIIVGSRRHVNGFPIWVPHRHGALPGQPTGGTISVCSTSVLGGVGSDRVPRAWKAPTPEPEGPASSCEEER